MQIAITRFQGWITCLIVAALLSVAAMGSAAEWPRFRGPNRDACSTETGLLQEWPANGPPLAWKANGIGDGYSSVAVVGDRIYTAGDKADSSLVFALNAADGKQVWAAKLGKAGAVGDPKFEGPRSTPTVDGDRVFAIGQGGEIACYETASGKEIWRKHMVADFGGVCPQWGYAESALVDGDKVLVTPGGKEGSIVALDKKSGAVVWRSKEFTDPPHYSSLILEEIGGVKQYIQLTAASVAGVSAADGKLLWKSPRRGQVAVIPSPVYHDGFVYVTSGYGVGCNLFKITAADGKFSAEQVYANKVMVNHHGGVIRRDNLIYGFSDGKGWTCQDFKTGEAKWQEKEKLGKGTILYADHRFYLRAEDKKGELALIEESAEGYKERGRFAQPNRSSKSAWAHLALVSGRLYVRDQDLLLCYDVKAK